MTDSEKIAACMKQADFAAQKLYNRQAHQWKITLGVWTLVCAAIATATTQRPVIVHYSCWAAIVVGHSFWVRYHYVRGRDDIRKYNHFRDAAEALLLDPDHSIKESPPLTEWKTAPDEFTYKFLRNPVHAFELGTTIVLVLVAYLTLR